MTNQTFHVVAHRLATGEPVAHLTRAFDDERTARAYADTANGKAFTPFFFFLVRTAA